MLLVFSFSVVVVTESLMMVVEDRNRMNSNRIFNNLTNFCLSSKNHIQLLCYYFLFIYKTSIYRSSKHLVDILLLHDLYFFMFGIDGRFYR